MADGIWLRFWWHGTGRQQNRSERANAMFMMTHDEIKHVLRQNKKITCGNPLVDYHPQKEVPNRIRITARENLVTHELSLLVCIADLDTAKLQWNSVISMS
jgi:hypothetical protein